MSKNTIFLLITLCIIFGRNVPQVKAQSEQKIQIRGKVQEKDTEIPIEYASIIFMDKTSDETLGGVVTDKKGQFKTTINALNFYVKISFIGFHTQTIREFEVSDNQVDLGNIILKPNTEMMDEVSVEAQKSETIYKLDKRIFNVGKDLLSAGGSALDVLNNVPSVEVNLEGVVSLRGNANVQILINGKPSVMTSNGSKTLGTLTAEMIEKVEVITNPSAKYDAEGTTGIINIILKKEEKKGVNGSLSLNTGAPKNHNAGVSLNYRTGKFNFFMQGGVGVRKLPRHLFGKTINNKNPIEQILERDGEHYRQEQFYNGLIGLDYHFNELNVMTLSANYAYEIEKEFTDILYILTEADESSTSRIETIEAKNPSFQYELHYKKSFSDHKKHQLTWSAIGVKFDKSKNGAFQWANSVGNFINSDHRFGSEYGRSEYTFQMDYTRPFADKSKLETGAKYVLSNMINDFFVEEVRGDERISNQEFTDIFDFQQNVLGAYATYGKEGKNFGWKVGLRMENTDFNSLLKTTQTSSYQQYTNFFPSVHTSYKLSNEASLQASYSRRIYRPKLWLLSPFFSIRDGYNIYTGNPFLQPEYTDSYELNSIQEFGNVSLNLGIFHQRTTQVIEEVSVFNAENIVRTKPENVGIRNRTGIELNTEYTPTKGLSLSSNVNWGYFDRKGTFGNANFDFSNQNWSVRLQAKLTLGKGFNAQIDGRYYSKLQQVGRTEQDNYFMNMGVRKKVLKNRGVINLNFRNIFATSRSMFVMDESDFYVTITNQSPRYMTLSFSYGFGKGEAMVYSGGR